MMGDSQGIQRVNGDDPYAPFKKIFERVHGPAVGPDLEFALHSFGYNQAAIHPDSFALSLERHASRFAGDFIRWITHGQRPLAPIATTIVTPLDAARAVFKTLHRTIFEFVEIMREANTEIISTMDAIDRQKVPSKSRRDLSSEHLFLALHDRIHAAILAYHARTDSVRDAPETIVFSDAEHVLASAFMNGGIIWLFFNSIRHGSPEKTSAYFDDWRFLFVNCIITAYRMQAALRLNEVDHVVLKPIEEALADMHSSQLAAMLPIANEFVAAMRGDNKRWQGIMEDIRNLPRIMPEQKAELSFVHHAMNSWYGHVNGDLQIIVNTLKRLSAPLATETQSWAKERKTITTCIGWIRESHGAADANLDTTLALDFIGKHFAHRGADLRVTGDERLPPSVNQCALRKALTLLIMNALDFPRPDVPLEIDVQIESDRIAVADNGRGMTPKRVAELTNGSPVESDHGGTGHGLYYLRHAWLPELFPKGVATPSLEIASQVGAGSTFTICFNFAKISM